MVAFFEHTSCKQVENAFLCRSASKGRSAMIARRHFLAGAGPAFLLGAQSLAVQAQDLPTIRFVLDWKYEGEHAQFTVPATDGTYRRLGLNVTLDRGNGSGDTIAKVAAGAYDMGLADTYAMVRFNANNPGNRLLSVAMVQDVSASGVVALRSKGINKPADLSGKRIYAPAADAGRILFPIFANLNNIDLNSIQWNTVTSDLRDVMLARREADAVTANTVTTVMNVRAVGVPESELAVFFYAKHGADLYGSSIVTTRAFAEKNPEAVRRFISAIVHGLNVMVADLDIAMASLKTYDKLLNDEVEKERMLISLRDMLITPNVLKNGFSSVDMERLDRTLKQVAPVFNIAAPPPSDVYTDSYLPPASERAVRPRNPAAK
jgi:NitT/TauT family transport system substrate-binding protein